ncbi:MAG: PhzF family phenazine biosynthesis protein [Thermoplasmata archaeon]|nr:MAG: PhzF family phenazine biosynthesis protein [Thermoplasmata archaeon]
MINKVFYILDVFAEGKYTGNQLAVVRNAGGLSESDMQKIAKEMNFSETTFIESDEEQEGGYNVRIFTPEAEVPFAGHPTLGTAYLIQQEIINEPVEKVTLNLKIGLIPVTFKYRGERVTEMFMKQNPPTFGATFEAEPIAEILDIKPSEINSKYPIMEVSTGLPFIIVPLKKLDSIKNCRLNEDNFKNFIKNTEAKAFLMFAPKTYNVENDLNVRVFAHYYGVPEDPATGSAGGCLTAYLVKHKYFGSSHVDIRVEQGYEIGRPSLILLKGDGRNDKIDVFVGGKVSLVAKGELL